MRVPSTPDLSLYHLALNNLASPQCLRVSSLTLKYLVGTWIDLLIEEEIPATIWAKLPPTQDWQSELKRYQQQSAVPLPIYWCSCVGDDRVEEAQGVEQVVDKDEDSRIFPVQLADSTSLKRESFFIILSEQLSGLIVLSQLYRPEVTGGVLGQNQPMLGVCTFERRVIQQVLEGIRDIVAIADTTPVELLGDWSTLFPSLADADEKTLLTQLLVKQIQHTEELLQTPTISSPRGIDTPNLHSPTDTHVQSATVPLAPTKHGDTQESQNVGGTNPHEQITQEELASPLLERNTDFLASLSHDDLRTKDEFLRRVVQELRTPLTNMKTALRLLDSAQLKPPQRQRYMQLLNTECDRQTSLITGLLDLVELESESPTPSMLSVQLLDIVPGVVSTYQPIAQEKNIQLGYTIPIGLPTVACSETWLRQIVIHLLHNSLKFTRSGGQVKVRGSLHHNYVQLEFEDTGIGIATSEIPNIFNSFYRGRSTTGENPGAGLGLTIVQQLLRRCGGSISVTSKLGEGSIFKVILPIASPPSIVGHG
ncbi:MAG TPA: DICT sensory domain-containing protein [Coleofasciculaceae cyanobacterium]